MTKIISYYPWYGKNILLGLAANFLHIIMELIFIQNN